LEVIAVDKIMKKNEKLANDIKKFIDKNKIVDTRVYFNNKCYDWNSSSEMTIVEDIKPSTYFEYANDSTVSMSFEGELNYIINYGTNNKKLEAFNKIFDKHNCYYELGYAWSLSVYYLEPRGSVKIDAYGRLI
jgi:hypothetical protein